MKKKKRFLLMLLLVISTVLCGCSDGKKEGEKNAPSVDETHSLETPTQAENQSPVYGGSIVVGITQDLDSLDPHKAVAAGTKEVLFNIFEGLVKPDEDGNLVPAIASDYTISEDGKSYTFVLREGVTFHNGALVTAEDIIYSLKRCAGLLEISDPEVLTVSAFSCIEDIIKVTTPEGKEAVKIILNTPNTELLGYLTCSIIPKDYDAQSNVPIGTGPFQFVSYAPLQSFVIEKNKSYYLEGKPYLDKVTFKISANTDSAFLELLGGGIDIFSYLTQEQANQLKEQYQIMNGTMNLVQGLFLNNAKEPFNNSKVRQALFYAVDPKQILDFVGGGNGSVIRSNMFPKFAKYYNSELESTYFYDTGKAKELLKEAGYENGFTFTIQVPSNYQYHIDTAQVIVEQLKQVGITAQIQLIEWSSWLSEVYKNRNYEATVVGLEAKLVPSDLLKRYCSDSSNNFTNYSNQEFDRIFDKALAATDEKEKVMLYKELQKILNEDAASVYIQDPPLLVAMNKKLSGYTFYPVYVQDMATVYYKNEPEFH